MYRRIVPLIVMFVVCGSTLAGCVAEGPDDRGTLQADGGSGAEETDPPAGASGGAEDGNATDTNATEEREPETTTYGDIIGGEIDQTHRFTIPDDASSLQIDAMWTAGGTVTIRLIDSDGSVVEEAVVTGGDERPMSSFYTTDAPAPGTWTITLDGGGGINYRFEVTY